MIELFGWYSLVNFLYEDFRYFSFRNVIYCLLRKFNKFNVITTATTIEGSISFSIASLKDTTPYCYPTELNKFKLFRVL